MATPTPALNADQRALVNELKGALDEHDVRIDERFRKLEDDSRLWKQRSVLLPPGTGDPPAVETPGMKFASSTEFANWSRSPGQTGRCVVPCLTTKAALLNSQIKPTAVRLPGVYEMPALPPALVELLAWRPVGESDTVQFLRESAAATPGAKSQAGEGALKAEQTISVELVTEAIETIAAWTSTSTQALSDTSQLSRFIDSVLTSLVLTEIDRQVLNGLGPASNELHGIVPNSMVYNTALTLAGDGPLDIISHAQAQLYASGVVANAVVLSPADAEVVRLTKDGNGGYLWGAPAAGAPASVWGLVPVVDGNLTSGFLVGDFSARSVELLWREQVLTQVSREHSDFFVKNMAAIRTEARCALGLYRPSAFVSGAFPVTPPAARSGTASQPPVKGK